MAGLLTIIQGSFQLAGHTLATISQKRRVAVLSKIKKADFAKTGKDLLGKGLSSA